MASVFTKIINGEIPCYRLMEDEHTLAFITLDQIKPGHSLVVPKLEIDHFIDCPEPYYTAVFRNAQILAKAIYRATGCDRIGTVIAGWDVPHFHYHVIPMTEIDDTDFRKAKQYSHEENLAMQQKIVDALKAL